MSVAGASFSLAIIYALAMNGDATTVAAVANPSNGAAAAAAAESEVAGVGLPLFVPNWDQLWTVAENVVDATVPLTATDMVSAAIGEGVAGLIGGMAAFAMARMVQSQREAKQVAPTVSDVVADGDYFLARAAALPLVQAAGLSSSLAMVATVLFAAVPYELIKLQSKRRQILIEEDKVLQQLLEQQKSKKEAAAAAAAAKNRFTLDAFSFLDSSSLVQPATTAMADLETLKPVRVEGDLIDFVEIFTDILLWLQYDVLVTDFGGTVSAMDEPLLSGLESALFGALASVSAQAYSDVLYFFFRLGGDKKRSKIGRRTMIDWTAIYFTRIISAAALFGVYDVAQAPIEHLVSALLSGGMLGCIGSYDYHMCVQSFMDANPTAPSPEAQLRALFTSLYSFWHQLVGV